MSTMMKVKNPVLKRCHWRKRLDFGQSTSILCWSGWQISSYINWLKWEFSILTVGLLWSTVNSSYLFILGNTYFSMKCWKHAYTHTYTWDHVGLRRMIDLSSDVSLWNHIMSLLYHITTVGSILSSPIHMDNKLNNTFSSNLCLFVLFYCYFN